MKGCVHMNTHICMCGNQKTTLARWTDTVHLFFLLETVSLIVLGVIQLGRWACQWALGSLLSLPLQHLTELSQSLASPVLLLHTQERQCLAVLPSVSQALGTELRSTLLPLIFFFSVLWIIMLMYEWLSIPLPSLGLPQMHTQERNKQTEN